MSPIACVQLSSSERSRWLLPPASLYLVRVACGAARGLKLILFCLLGGMTAGAYYGTEV